jgi:TonB family protein
MTACAVLLLASGMFKPLAIAQTPAVPAQYVDGALPSIPFQATGGGEVVLELAVDSRGSVTAVRTLRATPPFTEGFSQAARGWRFVPAQADVPAGGTAPAGATSRIAVASKVIVAAEIRPPSINTPTLGEPPTEVAPASPDAIFPSRTAMPPYPPLAREGGSVLVEVRVDSQGRVVDAKAVRRAPPFDEPALAAARQWTFRPASVSRSGVDTLAYIMFGFRQPVTTGPGPR